MRLNARGVHGIAFILEDVETHERFGGKILSTEYDPHAIREEFGSQRIIFESIEELDKTISLLQEMKSLREDLLEELEKMKEEVRRDLQ